MAKYSFSAELFRTVYRAASKEKTRYYLNGVFVTHAPGDQPGVVIVATDGHKMLVAYDPNGSAPKGEGIILQTEGHKVPAANFRDNRKLKFKNERVVMLDASDMDRNANVNARLCDVVRDDDGVREEIAASAHVFQIVDGSFPDWTRVVPDFGNCAPVDSASVFDARYLKTFCDAAADFQRDTKSKPISVWAKDPASPALVTFGDVMEGGRDLFGVLMPLRAESGAERGKPSWSVSYGHEPEALEQEPETEMAEAA